MKPLISVITISYNAKSVIERTIQSIKNQTYENIEYIIVDGASNDGTIEIIEKYKPHLSKWVSEKDNGIYDAMNKGLKMASGQYVLFINAGDMLYDDNILQMVIKQSDNADLIYGKAKGYTDEGEQFEWHKAFPAPSKLSYKSFIKGSVICHQCMLVKRDIAPLYDLQYKIAADIDWSIKILKQATTLHAYNDYFCKFLAGGESKKRVKEGMKERFRISVNHYGLLKTMVIQIQLLFNYAIKRTFNIRKHI